MKKLSLTVGITTCYGQQSIIETVKSLRSSKGITNFKFIIVADRIPLNSITKKGLKKYGVRLIENKEESSQMKKQKQFLKFVNSDLILLTQDDVLVDANTLNSAVEKFMANPNLDMVSVLNKPVRETTFFESVLSVGTNIASRVAKYWNDGDNYLSVIGRFMMFRTKFIKEQIRLREDVATSDAYYYFSTVTAGGVYKYIPSVAVYFKNPQNITEHLRKSSRFQFSKNEMGKYFGDLTSYYKVPKKAVIRAMSEEFLKNPIRFICYMGVFLYTRILRIEQKSVLNPIWEVDLSTKKINVSKII